MKSLGVRRALVAVSLTVPSACARSHPQTAPAPDATFEFTAQSGVDTLDGQFSGRALVHDGWMQVTVDRASINFPPGESMRWRSVVLHAFVAAEYNGQSWTAPVESRPTNLWPYLSFPPRPLPERTPINVRTPLRFLVPIPPSTDLSKARLALEIEWVALYREQGHEYGQTETNVAFSQPIVLKRLP